MKRIIAILLTFVMMLALCACDKAPAEMSKEIYKQGKSALEIIDKHLAGQIDTAEAEKQLNVVRAAVEEEMKNFNLDPSNPNYVNDYNYSMTAKSVQFSIKSYVQGMNGETNTIGKIPDLQETRDFLYSTLTGSDQNKG